MEQQTLYLLNEVNRAIIKFRGLYSLWAGAHNISYNEMLVFYTIREKGFCTQKQICDSYLLPWQTMNHVITALRQDGILEISDTHSKGREKAFVLFVPLGFLFSRLGLSVFWLTFPVTEALTSLVGSVYYRRFLHNHAQKKA